MNNFKTILAAVFIAFFVFGVLVFAGIINIGGNSSNTSGLTGKVIVWGTFDATPDFLNTFQGITDTNKDLTIQYIKKPKATYQQSLIEAFAAGNGPDLFIISPDMIVKNKNFIYTIPYSSYPEKTFRDAFIDGADVYLNADGVVAFPVVVDPIVMYYNKDLLSNEGLSQPPTTWDELVSLAPALTKKQNDGTILQSMIGLGRFDNVTNAKDILATLLLQNNNPIIQKTTAGYVPVLNSDTTLSAEHVMDFFTRFSDPSDPAYSWNRSLGASVNMFTGGHLAFYLGHASELFTIQSVNPNLSFDVAAIPQTQNAAKRTYADIYAVAVNKKSANASVAFSVAGLLSSGDTEKSFAAALSLPPASRSLLATKPTDPYLFTFFNQAVISRSWPDPDTNQTDAIFNELVENILSSKMTTSDALGKAQNQLQLLTNQ